MGRLSIGAVAALALTGYALEAAPALTPAPWTSEAVVAASMISAHRAAYGLSAVSVDGRLNQAAEQQARAVAQAGWLSHGDFAGRMRQHGIRGTSAENLSAGTSTVIEAIEQWRASPAHNSNLLLPQARRIGLGSASGGHGRYWALVLGQ